MNPHNTDIILDTDIGTDVDDAYALLLAIVSPEIRPRGVTLVHGDLEVRSLIAAKVLTLSNRMDIPILRGESTPMNRERPIVWPGHEGRGIDFSDVAGLPLPDEHAAEFIARTAVESPGQVTLVTIGPMTNAGILVRDHPREASMLRGIVSMVSTFNGFGAESAAGEHNAALDPEAMELVLRSGIQTLIVGLNVTIRTSLTRAHLAQMEASRTDLARLMVHMTEDWLRVIGRDETCMHDPLAVVAVLDQSLVTTVPVRAELLDDGSRVAYYEAHDNHPVRICTSVDADRFHDVFHPRIARAVSPTATPERQQQ